MNGTQNPKDLLRTTATPTPDLTSGGKTNIFLRNPRILLLKHIFTLVILYVSIFAETPSTPASPSERLMGVDS